MSISDKLAGMSESLANKENQIKQGHAKQQAESANKIEQIKNQQRVNAAGTKRDIAESVDQLKEAGTDLKSDYWGARNEMEEGIAKNHGTKPGGDGMVATGASLVMRIIGLAFGALFLGIFIYILIGLFL